MRKLVRAIRSLVRILIIAAGAVMVVEIIRESLDPNRYHYWVGHPTGRVVRFCLYVILETAAVFFVLGRDHPGRLWQRGGATLIVLLLWTLWCSGFLMHAPAFAWAHALWLWALVGIITVCVLGSAGLHMYSAAMARRQSHGGGIDDQ